MQILLSSLEREEMRPVMGELSLMLSYIAPRKKPRGTIDPGMGVLIKATETGCQNTKLNLWVLLLQQARYQEPFLPSWLTQKS